jgi:hypothetical protein
VLCRRDGRIQARQRQHGDDERERSHRYLQKIVQAIIVGAGARDAGLLVLEVI